MISKINFCGHHPHNTIYSLVSLVPVLVLVIVIVIVSLRPTKFDYTLSTHHIAPQAVQCKTYRLTGSDYWQSEL